MAGFRSEWAFHEFSESVLRRFRYVHEPAVRDFLDAVRESAQHRTVVMHEGQKLRRAQIGCCCVEIENEDGEPTMERDVPFPAIRMKPVRHEQHPGRLNALGTNCLYLSAGKTDDESIKTAIAEVRPWHSANVSVALCRNPSFLQVVYCASGSGPTFWLEDDPPDDDTTTEIVWSHIDHAFSRPVGLKDESRGYIPTQILAELFRSEGFDGVVYKSSLAPGRNLAVFDLDAIDIVRVDLYQVTSVDYEFSRWG